jgi:hypothetical protein
MGFLLIQKISDIINRIGLRFWSSGQCGYSVNREMHPHHSGVYLAATALAKNDAQPKPEPPYYTTFGFVGG